MKLGIFILAANTLRVMYCLLTAKDNCDIYKILGYGFELIFCGLFFIVLEIASISRVKDHEQ